ncbi:putative kraken, partial [Operophtera brumata]
LTWGSPSNPPVLLCHGKLDTCSGFRPLVSLLPACFYYWSWTPCPRTTPGRAHDRLTFDQRMKEVTILPFSADSLQQLYTTTRTPTFCVLAKRILDAGVYDPVPFIKDEAAWPNNNYRVKVVEGWHDVHISDPGCMADDVARFLMADLKVKL